jgi:hypothetical protein
LKPHFDAPLWIFDEPVYIFWHSAKSITLRFSFFLRVEVARKRAAIFPMHPGTLNFSDEPFSSVCYDAVPSLRGDA